MARALADRHYSRRTRGAIQFAPPARVLVLVVPCGGGAEALWISSWPKAEFVKIRAHAGAWFCTMFRNEAPDRHLSSSLVVEALAATRAAWGDPPEGGLVTFVDEEAVRTKRDPGRCFRKAGFEVAGRTSDRDLLVLRIRPAMFPPPLPALERQPDLFAHP